MYVYTRIHCTVFCGVLPHCLSSSQNVANFSERHETVVTDLKLYKTFVTRNVKILGCRRITKYRSILNFDLIKVYTGSNARNNYKHNMWSQ